MAYKLNITGEELQSLVSQLTTTQSTLITLKEDCFDEDVGTNALFLNQVGQIVYLVFIASMSYFSGALTVGTWTDDMPLPEPIGNMWYYVLVNANNDYGVKFLFKTDHSIVMSCFGDWPSETIGLMWASPAYPLHKK